MLTLFQQPPNYASAYKPVSWGFTSTKYPNTEPGESLLSVFSIEVADAGDVANYGNGLEVGDCYVFHDTVNPNTFVLGQAVLIEGTSLGLYSGQYRVLKPINDFITVLDTEYVGDDTGGQISKFYERYSLEVTITMQGQSGNVVKTIYPDKFNIFELDLSDVAQRSFGDVFDIATPGAPTALINASGYITVFYSFEVREGYMIPNALGINEFTITRYRENQLLPPDYSSPKGFYIVNSAHPYHHVETATGDIDLVWEDDYKDYIASSPVLNRKFLTYCPRGYRNAVYYENEATVVGPDDSHYLAILTTTSAQQWEVIVASYDQSNATIQVSDLNIGTPAAGSMMVAVGPENLGSLIHPDADHYIVALRNAVTENHITEGFAFRIDRDCSTNPERFYWLGSLGGIDAFTFKYDTGSSTSVERRTISKPHMRTDLYAFGVRGDWQRRVFSTEIARSFSHESKKVSKAVLRFVVTDLFESASVRIAKYINEFGQRVWTHVIPTNNEVRMPVRGGKVSINYELGVDNNKQRT